MTAPALKRQLGAVTVGALVVGNMLGSGIFFTPGELGGSTDLLRDIFKSIFVNYSTERRILIFNSLLSAQIEARDKKQGRGQKIRTMLEAMGVIGVKVGQYLSEQPELFKDAPDIQAELKNLKKDAAPFHIRAIFQLLQEAGLLEEIPSLGQRLGSASIKQVYEVLMKNGKKAAGKFLRPAAENPVARHARVVGGGGPGQVDLRGRRRQSVEPRGHGGRRGIERRGRRRG